VYLRKKWVPDPDSVKILANLVRSPQLQRLNLSGNSLTGASYAALGSSVDLSGLQELLAAVSQGNLLSLDISQCGLQTAGLKALGLFLKENPKLEELDISQNFRELESRTLIQQDNRVQPGMHTFPRITPGQAAEIKEAIECIAQALEQNVKLKVLHCRHLHLNSEFLNPIAQALSRSSKLHSLQLSDNLITRTGFITLFESLQNNNHLTSLDLHNNYSEQITLPMFEVLRKNWALRCLNLKVNRYANLNNLDTTRLDTYHSLNETVLAHLQRGGNKADWGLVPLSIKYKLAVLMSRHPKNAKNCFVRHLSDYLMALVFSFLWENRKVIW